MVEDQEQLTETSFVLGFSKLLKDYLIAEIVRDPIRMKSAGTPFMAEVLRILFVFEPGDKICKVFYSRLIIN